jgi:hypothetical protein
MTRSNGSGQITVSDRLDSPAYVSDDEEVRRGQEAWSRLKEHMSWSDWTAVGRAHLKGRQAAMREACTNDTLPTSNRLRLNHPATDPYGIHPDVIHPKSKCAWIQGRVVRDGMAALPAPRVE